MQQEFRPNRLLLWRERQYTALKKQKEYDIISSETIHLDFLLLMTYLGSVLTPLLICLLRESLY